MKIYTKIRIDLKTGKTIEEESFEYDGPLALCGIAESYEQEDEDAGDALGGGYGDGDGGWYGVDDFADTAMEISPGVTTAPSGIGVTQEDWDNFQKNQLTPSTPTMTAAEAIADLASISGWENAKKGFAIGLGVTGPVGGILGGIIGFAYGAAKTGMQYSDLVSSIADSIAANQNISPAAAKAIAENAAKSAQETIREGGEGEASLVQAINASSTGSAAMQLANSGSTQGWGGSMTDQLGNLLGASAPDMTAFNSAMDEFRNVNTDIKFLHDMSELEGVTLSAEEKGFLETMRLNATTNLTNNVNEATLNLAESEIARMVNKGVLQGNIGSETMSKIYEKAGKVVGEQSRNIESDVAKMGLGVLEQKKLNTMNLWGKELEADIASATVGTDKWKSVGMLELGKAEQGQKWNQSLIDSLTTMRGQDLSFKAAELGASTNLNLAGQEMRAWKKAQDKQMWGNIGSALISAWA